MEIGVGSDDFFVEALQPHRLPAAMLCMDRGRDGIGVRQLQVRSRQNSRRSLCEGHVHDDRLDPESGEHRVDLIGRPGSSGSQLADETSV